MSDSVFIEKSYASSRERYAALGVDTEKALGVLGRVSLSLHCRRHAGDAPGVAEEPVDIRTLREDLHEAFSLIPGPHRLGLSAVHAESSEGAVERNALEPAHFRGWVEWAKQEGLKLDLSAACTGHPQAASGFSLSHREKEVRRFWIEHVRRCRKISASIGRELKAPCFHTLYIPDSFAAGARFDKWARREQLRDSLDEIFESEHSLSQMRDALESRPDGSERFAVATPEFCMAFAMSRGKLIGLSLGRDLSAVSAADKVSAILQFSDEILVRFSGEVAWEDSRSGAPDGGTLALAREIVRGGALDLAHIGVEDPGAGPYRVGAWAAGARAMLKTLLLALLEDASGRSEREDKGGEQLRRLPFGSVWDEHCLRSGVPPEAKWRKDVSEYEGRARAGRP